MEVGTWQREALGGRRTWERNCFLSFLGSPQSPKTVSLKLSQLQTPPSKSLKKSSVKATRSKAWLDEYTTSSDPIKIFLAAVYAYHDSNGEYIAQPFLELPSRKVRGKVD